MNTYVLGAGASHHAGYPLTRTLLVHLARWVEATKPPNHDYRIRVDELRNLYGRLDDFERLFADLDDPHPGSKAYRINSSIRPIIRSDLIKALQEFFAELRQQPAEAYEVFARNRANPGDVIITFNYDVSLERELKKKKKWEIGNGYGFHICTNLNSDIKLLKLHGSTNWVGAIFNGSIRGFHPADSSMLGDGPFILAPEFQFLGYRGDCDPGIKGAQIVPYPCLIMPTSKKNFYVETPYGRE